MFFGLYLVCVGVCVWERASTWYIVSEANSGESDDHKVEGLEKEPVLHLLEYHRWHGEEDQTADQNGQNG